LFPKFTAGLKTGKPKGGGCTQGTGTFALSTIGH
jgi:hypothetical protein